MICKPFSFGQVSGFGLVFPAFSGFFQREFGKILGRDYRCVPAFLGVEHVRSVLAAELSSKCAGENTHCIKLSIKVFV